MRIANAVAAGAIAVVLAACGGAGDQPAPDDTATAVAPPAAAAVDTPVAAGGESSSTTQAPASSGSAVPRPSVPIAGADTARGAVRLLGTAVDSRVVVQTPAGPVGVTGPHAPAIARLQGMDVWIQGPLSLAIGAVIPPRQITVERFEVRAVAGVPVVDGTLREEGGSFVVVDQRGGRTSLTNPPADLRALVGRRVWVTRAADGGVAAFGEI